MKNNKALVIVAHPDDETLWAGGTILDHPEWEWTVISLTRSSDLERAEKFQKALIALGASGRMGDMDDGPDQIPMDVNVVQENIMSLLPSNVYDIVLTHHPTGEYTRHLRHEETSRAVIGLWQEGKISAKEMWIFAYEDGGRQYYPKAKVRDTGFEILTVKTWERKYHIIHDIYGFDEKSWEAQTTPREESFIKIKNPEEALLLLENNYAI